MNAYLPSNPTTAWLLAMLVLGVLMAAFGISRMRPSWMARGAAWLLVVASALTVERLTSDQPAGLRMAAIMLSTLWAMKAVVSVEEQIAGKPGLRPLSWWIFAACWLGMRPTEFAAVPGPPLGGSRELIVRGVKRLVLGLALVVAARLVWEPSASNQPNTARFVTAAALLLTGLSLILHFGLLNMLAGLWRRFGANCRALFRAPPLSTSLAEFWGKRWNLAFSEMTAIAVVRPLRPIVGARAATVSAFLFSGLLHELAISVPVKAGFGLPMLYFVLHGMAMLLEQALDRAGLAVNRFAWLGRLWTAAWVLAPLPLLFHPPFLRGCLWPIIS